MFVSVHQSSSDFMHSDPVTTERNQRQKNREEKATNTHIFTHLNSLLLLSLRETDCRSSLLFLAGSDFLTWLLAVKVDVPGDAVKDQNSAVIFS